jgi:hypothetical protein
VQIGGGVVALDARTPRSKVLPSARRAAPGKETIDGSSQRRIRAIRQDLKSVAATRAGSGNSGVERVKHLVVASALAIVVTGCALPADRAVRAYNGCISRHPQEAALCEGPRQAYEVDTSTYRATAAAISPQAGNSSGERLAAAHPALTPVPLHRSLVPVTSGPNE